MRMGKKMYLRSTSHIDEKQTRKHTIISHRLSACLLARAHTHTRWERCDTACQIQKVQQPTVMCVIPFWHPPRSVCVCLCACVRVLACLCACLRAWVCWCEPDLKWRCHDVWVSELRLYRDVHTGVLRPHHHLDDLVRILAVHRFTIYFDYYISDLRRARAITTSMTMKVIIIFQFQEQNLRPAL